MCVQQHCKLTAADAVVFCTYGRFPSSLTPSYSLVPTSLVHHIWYYLPPSSITNPRTLFLAFHNLFPCIRPSNVIFSNESCLRIWPNHLFCRLLFLCLTICNTSSFVLCSVHDTFIIRLHIHISNASSRRISSFGKVHVLLPYNTTLQTNTFTICFRIWRLRDFCMRSFFLLKASFPNTILLLTSWQLYRLQSPDFWGNKTVSLFPGFVH